VLRALGETFVVRNNNGVSRALDYFEITRYMTLIERLPVGVALMENRFSDRPRAARNSRSKLETASPFSIPVDRFSLRENFAKAKIKSAEGEERAEKERQKERRTETEEKERSRDAQR